MSLASEVNVATVRRWPKVAALLGVLFAMVPVAPAAAQSKGADAASAARNQARSYQVAGNRLVNAGRWEDAYAEFAIAWQLSPDWQSAGDLGKAAYRTKHWSMAANRLGLYLREAPAGRISAKERTDVETWRAEAIIKSGALTLIAPDGAEIAIDGEVAGVAPLAAAIAVDPGKHEIVARAGGRSESQSTQLLAGETRELRFFAPTSGDGGAATGGGGGGGSSAGGGSGQFPLRPVVVIGGAALAVGGIVAGSVFLDIAGSRGGDKQKAALDVNGREAASGFAAAEAEARNGALWSFVGAGLCAAGSAAVFFTTGGSAKAKVNAAFTVHAGGPAIVVQGQF